MLLMTIVDSLLGVASVCEIKRRKILAKTHLPNLATSTDIFRLPLGVPTELLDV